jgi:hypothetical protein
MIRIVADWDVMLNIEPVDDDYAFVPFANSTMHVENEMLLFYENGELVGLIPMDNVLFVHRSDAGEP